MERKQVPTLAFRVREEHYRKGELQRVDFTCGECGRLLAGNFCDNCGAENTAEGKVLKFYE